jgi:hypothetical protein
MTKGELMTGMIDRSRHRRFVAAQLMIGTLLTLRLTYLSLAIADHVGTPEFVRYVLSPGYVLGVRFATGRGFLDTLGSFGRIAITINMISFGLISLLIVVEDQLAEAAQKSTASLLDGALIPTGVSET